MAASFCKCLSASRAPAHKSKRGSLLSLSLSKAAVRQLDAWVRPQRFKTCLVRIKRARRTIGASYLFIIRYKVSQLISLSGGCPLRALTKSKTSSRLSVTVHGSSSSSAHDSSISRKTDELAARRRRSTGTFWLSEVTRTMINRPFRDGDDRCLARLRTSVLCDWGALTHTRVL